ncbi:SMI1/KNR4 family protein [Pseudoalteromonas sp. SMS1]|uniref:SMI1/KNR4 family protein n=1 Tax=Pseudoalteromonas sp. SMS1 TaxID=2908894 RepID=UPI001F1EA262|nr:SMI1/KNR4 family protein [Pseudoalteromonas sp. SMS1]MCF2860457.1 SMI1/KNR4 family protein [Pseudoalteromonas sp. SMS1]
MNDNKEMLMLLHEIKNVDVAISSKLADDFLKLEEKLGVTLPNDYKSICMKFDIGGFYSYLYLFSPKMEGGVDTVHKKISNNIDMMLENLDGFPEFYDYKVFPEKGGLLPFGYSDNIDYLCWVCEGESSEWKVAVRSQDGYDVEYFDYTLIDFLIALWTTKDMSKILGDFTNGERIGFQ